MSELCLGTMNFGGRTSETDSLAIIEQGLGSGINFIDTANVYGHDPSDFEVGRGRSEEIVGRALNKLGRRDQVVLATKLHFPMSTDENDRGNSRRNIIAACHASLKRLQTDHIDLLQLHHPQSNVPIDETLRALDDLVRTGLVRYIGTSSFGAWQIIESLWVSKEHHLNRFVSEQPAYNLLDRRAERELLPMAQTYGIAVLPWSPLAGGALSGRYTKGASAPGPDTRYGSLWGGGTAEHVLTPEAFKAIEALAALAADKGVSLAHLAVAWCVAQPGVASAIIGPRTLDQLEDYLSSQDVALDPEDSQRIDRIVPPGRATVPFYGADGFAWTTWGPHTHRW